jgi:site-specific recombinase XerD
LYVLYRVDGAEPEPFVPLLRFFLETGKARKLPAQRSHAGSVRLLLDYLAASGTAIDTAGPEALRDFVHALTAGTVDERGADRRGLFWRGVSLEVARGHLQRVSAFADWFTSRTGATHLNPWHEGSDADRRAAQRRYTRRSSFDFLAHLAARPEHGASAVRARSVQLPSSPAPRGDIDAFEEAHFARFLRDGWRWRSTKRYEGSAHRLRDLLISILLHAGGLRSCEVFHLFVGDVVPDPNRPGHALVWMFHPERGEAPAAPGRAWRDREHYLRDRFNLLPRTLVAGRFHAGWKNLALTDSRRKAAQVVWHPTSWGSTFWSLYGDYLRLRSDDGTHPYLFVSERPAQKGQPYTLSSFRSAQPRAVQRAGLAYGKHEGTSPHGHRHAYVKRLTDGGLDRRHIARAVRHRELASQDAYNRPTHADVDAAVRAASDCWIVPSDFLTRRRSSR